MNNVTWKKLSEIFVFVKIENNILLLSEMNLKKKKKEKFCMANKECKTLNMCKNF